MKKYRIESFGCQMSMHDAERMAGLLEREGFRPTDEHEPADLVVINTCSVRELAEEKLYSRLGEIRAEAEAADHRPIVAVTGCVAQQEGSRLRQRSPMIDVIVGTQAFKQLPALVEQAARGEHRRPLIDVNAYDDVSFPFGVTRRFDPVKAYVTIIEGCNDHCAFCVVPYTRGHERMRPAAQILGEVREAAATGRREVQLLGQIVNHYMAPDDPSCDFAGLLAHVAKVPGIDRIRFASPHPRHVSDRLIEAYRTVPKICRHLHLPVQSGSTRLLVAMRRRYTREDYVRLVERLRSAIPDLAISTDMIVGFPGETPADFDDTLTLVREVGFSAMFSFKYSPRPNTLARKRMVDDVPELEKTRRIIRLQEVQREIQAALHGRAVGLEEEVLVDGESRRGRGELAGRTSGNTVVNFPGERSWIGRFARVRVERAGPNSLSGTVTSLEPPRRVPDNGARAGAAS
jgi:tRNA-2-methylthio-N6-dimethylallyladenosine synthase